MAFKIYHNRKTRHPSISLKSGDKKYWHYLEVTHRTVKEERYLREHHRNKKDDVNLITQFESPI